MEAEHIAQSIYLQCGSLNLGAVAVGALHDERVKLLLGDRRGAADDHSRRRNFFRVAGNWSGAERLNVEPYQAEVETKLAAVA